MSWHSLDGRGRDLLLGLAVGLSLSVVSGSIAAYVHSRRQRRQHDVAQPDFSARPIELRSDEIVDGVSGLIGNTPLIRINSLSDALGVEILGKAEFLNPGGSIKDRVALRIIQDAEDQGLLYPNTNSMIFEGTVGSTGISIATVAKARGYQTTIIIPDDVAAEKSLALQALGASLERVRPASIVDPKQFVSIFLNTRSFVSLPADTPTASQNLAKQRALEFGRTTMQSTSSIAISTLTSDEAVSKGDKSVDSAPRGFFADQFENVANHLAHFEGTGPEIWRQTNGGIDAFVSGAGTGGTISGIGKYLKSVDPNVQVILCDPEGSGLYNRIKYGVMFDKKESEGTKRRHQVDTVVEGIGINRLTKNFELGLSIIDDAYRVTDEEAVAMSRYLVQHDGLFLGSSSACNLVACVKLAKSKRLGKGSGRTIVTILCDSGARHYSKFWNDEYLANAGIPIDVGIIDALLLDD